MSKRIRIEVTPRDIEHGIRGDSSRCMIAVAIARAVPNASRIEVDTQTVRFTDGEGSRWAYITPPIASQYVVDFDAGDPIDPFAFTLDRDRAVKVRRRVLTSAADKATMAARKKVKRTKTQGGLPSPELIEVASTSIPYAVDDPSARPGPRRVFKTKRRSYGHRQLRVNREP